MKEAPVVFVDEGSGFKPKPPVTKAPVVREMTISNWDDNLESMAKILEQGREKLYEHIKGFHAGMCLVTILILPSYQSDFPNAFPVAPGINYTTSQIPEVFELGRAVGNVSFLVPLPAMLDIYGELTLSQFNKKFNTTFWKNTTWNNLYTYSKVRNVQYNQTDSFRFVGWYSEYAVNLNVVFQLLSTLCLLGALHQASPPASWFGEAVFRYRDPKHILRLVFILSMFICYFCTVLITPIDTGLHESTMTQGGRFGMQLWQFNQTALSDPLTQADLAYWRQMNWMRGFCGLLGWLCSFLSLEYQRQREEEKQEYKIIPV
ncbi:hypothetical protein EDD86DRAFT_213866 [Gorgonomyces haynaldii]|nr:hypothetical protein EDD86DRAFT_213866 [Gorgonomyces haynaldii]